jgi:dihydrodipicolinate synthase/N-acetylneuraminate lyase
MMAGAAGLVSGGASALPELFKSLVVAQRKGDYRGALEAQKTIQKVKDIVKAGPIGAYYEILRERGIDCGRPRAPLLPLEEADSMRVMASIRSLGLI